MYVGTPLGRVIALDAENGRELWVARHSPDLFEPVRGRRARRSRETGEVWQADLLHGDHWEVYKTVRDFERGNRDRAVWSDGRHKERF